MHDFYIWQFKNNKMKIIANIIFYSLFLWASVILVYNLSPAISLYTDSNDSRATEVQLIDNVEPISVFLSSYEKISNVKNQFDLMNNSENFEFYVTVNQPQYIESFPGYDNLPHEHGGDRLTDINGVEFVQLPFVEMNDNSLRKNSVYTFNESDFYAMYKGNNLPALFPEELKNSFSKGQIVLAKIHGISVRIEIRDFTSNSDAVIIPAQFFPEISRDEERLKAEGIHYLQMISGTAVLNDNYSLVDFFNEIESYRNETNGIILDALNISVDAKDSIQINLALPRHIIIALSVALIALVIVYGFLSTYMNYRANEGVVRVFLISGLKRRKIAEIFNFPQFIAMFIATLLNFPLISLFYSNFSVWPLIILIIFLLVAVYLYSYVLLKLSNFENLIKGDS